MKMSMLFFTFTLLLNSQCATRNDNSSTKFDSISSDDLCGAQRKTHKIPKILHQIWHDWGRGRPNPPAEQLKFAKDLQTLNPHWKYMYWENANSREFIKEHYSWFLPTYDGYSAPIKRVDALRYFLLDYYGGLYVDLDTIPLKPIDPLLEGCDIVVGQEYGDFHIIGNDFMASVADHPFWKDMQNRLVKNKDKHNVLVSTGPVLLTDAVHAYKQEHNEPFFKVYGNAYFHPLGPNHKASGASKTCVESVEKCKEIFPQAFMISLFEGSWH